MKVLGPNPGLEAADTNQAVKQQISNWIELTGAELADPRTFQNMPALSGKDLAPQSKDPSGLALAPGDCYAVGMRADGLPVDIIDYQNESGQTDPTEQCAGNLSEKQQFLFTYAYDQTKAQNVVAIQQWRLAEPGTPGDAAIIGNAQNDSSNHNHIL
jgi:hypothetical protein